MGQRNSINRSQIHPSSGESEYVETDDLSALNIDCLLEIFKWLNIETICTLTNVCKRFRSAAELTFRRNYKIEYLFSVTSALSYRRVLCKFGHLIESIDVSPDSNFDVDSVVKYCHSNLKHLNLDRMTIDCNFVAPLFKRLITLQINDCKLIGDVNKLFENCVHLEKLLFNEEKEIGKGNGVLDTFIIHKFPKLKEITLTSVPIRYHVFHEFLSLNSQLKRLNIEVWGDDRFISAIAKHTSNLQELKMILRSTEMATSNQIEQQPQTKEGFLELAKLTKLTSLELSLDKSIYDTFAGSLMHSFAASNVPIEELCLFNFKIDSMDVRQICRLKTINTFRLFDSGHVSENDLISLVMELPLLATFESNRSISITADSLMKVVRFGERLKFIDLGMVENLHIDKYVFDALVTTVEKREREDRSLTILAIAMNSSLNVPQQLRESYKKLVHITFCSIFETHIDPWFYGSYHNPWFYNSFINSMQN